MSQSDCEVFGFLIVTEIFGEQFSRRLPSNPRREGSNGSLILCFVLGLAISQAFFFVKGLTPVGAILACMAKKLAFMTYGKLVEEFGHPTVQGFVDRVPGVYDAADATPGFVDRSKRSLEDYGHSWGKIVTPRCWGGETNLRSASTLSLWDDVESVAAFAYHGKHGEAMKLRNEWFEHPGLPEHVAWWVGDVEEVDWQAAADRMDHLHEHGSTAHAFTIRSPFDANGNPYKLDTSIVREKVAST